MKSRRYNGRDVCGDHRYVSGQLSVITATATYMCTAVSSPVCVYVCVCMSVTSNNNTHTRTHRYDPFILLEKKPQ